MGNVYSRDLRLVANRLFHHRILPEMSSVLATDQHSRKGFNRPANVNASVMILS